MQIDFGSELVVHPGFNKFSAFVLGLFVVVENVVWTVDPELPSEIDTQSL